MSLRNKIKNNPMVAEFGQHDDTVPDYKYYVLLKDAYWHADYMGRYHSATSLQGVVDYLDGAIELPVETLCPVLDRYGMG
tara:strand:- start:494 stop:733 length:240 start_codon:yes stop_codon:yes gene_type:complete